MATESYQGSMDGNPMDGISQVPSQGRQSSQSPGPSGKNYDNANESNPTIQPTSRSPTNKPPGLDPSSLPESHDIPIAPAFAMQEEDLNKGSPVSQFHSSPLSRSNTVRTSSDQQHNWASDRSPLQKLEVALGGISKEEKRARALEAERKLKERMAAASAKSAVNPVPPVPIAPQPGASSSSPPRSSTQKVKQPDSRNEEELENISAQPEPARERPRTARGGAPAFQPAVARPLEESQYARNKPRGTQVVKAGTVPRRSVSVNYQSDGARMAPQAPNQNQGPINRNPLSRGSVPSGPPRMPDSGQNYRQQQQQQPGHHSFNNKGWASAPSSGLQQVGTNGQPFQDLATTGPAVTNLNNPNEIWDVEKSVELGGLDKLQNSQSKPKRNTVSFNVPPPTPPPLSEWKTAPTGRLNMSDFDFQNLDVDKSKAWWEGGETQNRRQSRALPKNYQKPPAQKLTSHKRFQPLIFLKCGPLLRYTGLKRVRVDGPHGPVEKETWRGSILIVTKDSVSSYEPRPTIRLFSQPMDILPPPPAEINSEGVQLAPEYIDPTAGLMKLGRDGRPLYVKPVEHTEEELDLSLVESDDGIYEMSASAVDHNSEGTKQPIPANRIHSMDGETAGTYKEITGFRLYADSGRDVTFWRFNIEIELGEKQQRVAYRLNQGPAIGFWVPAKGQSMNIMFHSCNGFTPGVDSNKFCGPDPLWRDVLNEHQTRPFHVMIGGGDQIFNDNVIANSLHFQEWLKIKDSYDKYDAPLHVEFKAELEMSYLENYSRWFSQGLFSLASSQIPMVNIWNDHEILEGFGSYPDEFMSSPVISGLGNIAFKYYLLFQHHSVPEETEVDEPSWLLGAEPGPYINQRSRNIFLSLGGGMALLGLDCRTERMCDEILTEHTTDLIWDRCHRELTKGETKHLIVLSSIPVAYPRVAVVKNILNSRQSLGKAGLFGGFVNKHGGKVEIFDDHWTAKHHKSERTYLIEDLQDLAAEKSIRVTILSGDVHLAAIGQFYSNPSLNIPKDKDYRYMPNIIASGIADMPTTEMISDTLNRRNHVHHMDTNTDEDMIPIFTHDVNNKARNNKRLLPRRNWCSIRVYQPGSTPAATPKTEASSPTPEEPRPNMLQRTLSLTRGDRPQGGLLRRLSHKGRPPTKEFNLGGAAAGRRMSMDSSLPPAGTGESYFPPPEDFRPGPFLRRPTNLSQKAAKKAAKRENDGAGTFVNLEGGLAVTLNLELNPKDPSGITAPYKLLVPALWYDGTEYDPPAAPITKGWRKWLGMRRNNASKHSAADNNEAEYGFNDEGEEYNREGEEEVNEARAHGHGPLDDEYESDLDLEPEPDVQENPKRRKWFGRRL
ncbi:hypothetical protein AOCH_001262 [Aspergillus ochraceoroseus]|uniref:PhoD-like phosphatase domain-containing protein n=2 Tax=Aspergillus ochraceoroseus TaxID=138278 RepID=A0A0F8W273_9EURO|nr:hypothetical protein AOCH_001262 [Aspergillus ochraceoroseus]